MSLHDIARNYELSISKKTVIISCFREKSEKNRRNHGDFFRLSLDVNSKFHLKSVKK